MSAEQAADTEQPADQPTKHRRRRKSIEGEPLSEFPEKDRQILRFGAFGEKRYEYLGLKPGVTADDINPNWRSEAIRWLFAASAVDSSIHARKGGRARRVAEILASMVISSGFSRPAVTRDDETGDLHLYAGEFWYLGVAERDELFQLFEATTNHPDFPHLPEVLEGISEGLDLINDTVVRIGKIQEQSEIDDFKKIAIQTIVAHEKFYPSYQEAVKVLITGNRFSRKRTLTPDKGTEALTIYSERHRRVRAAKRDYTVHKRRHRGDWLKHVTRDDKERPGQPKIPAELLEQLPHQSAREIALQWTATELNRRYRGLGATPNTVRNLLKMSKETTVIKAETHIQ